MNRLRTGGLKLIFKIHSHRRKNPKRIAEPNTEARMLTEMLLLEKKVLPTSEMLSLVRMLLASSATNLPNPSIIPNNKSVIAWLSERNNCCCTPTWSYPNGQLVSHIVSKCSKWTCEPVEHLWPTRCWNPDGENGCETRQEPIQAICRCRRYLVQVAKEFKAPTAVPKSIK